MSGFFLEHRGRRLYTSGHPLWHPALADFARSHVPDVALVHLGAATFAPTGPIRYSANLRDLAAMAEAWPAAELIPIHFEGWSHFEGRPPAFASLRPERPLSGRLRCLSPGEREALLGGGRQVRSAEPTAVLQSR